MATEDVAQVKQALLAQGENLDGPCGAFKITSTVAWRLRGQGWGLIASTGNGCPEGPHGNCRTDTLMLKDGSVIDCLQKAENNEGMVYPAVPQDSYNIPTWSPTGPQPPENWREPYDPGILEDGGSSSGGGDTGGGGADTQTILDAIAASQQAVCDHVTAEADRTIQAVLDDLKRLEEEVEQFAAQLGKALIIIRKLRGEPEP
jgi:hypothetical protein